MTSRSAMGRKRGTSDGQPSGGVPRPAINRSQTFSIGTDENPQHTTTTSSATRTTTPNSSFYKTCPCPLERVDSRAPPSSPEYRSVFSPDSVLSPEASFGQTPSYRSRAQSIASGLSERLRATSFNELIGEATIKLGQRIKGGSHKSQRKAERKRAGKPSQPDLFEKPQTKKLEKFWGSVENSDFASTLKKSIVHPHLNVEPGTELLTPVREEEDLIPPVPPIPTALELEQYKKKRKTRKDLDPPMDASRLQPAGRSLADQQDKARRVKDAQDLYENIVRNAERSGTNVPPYEFLELIGKGAFGRVYKCKDKRNGNLVAVKIVNIDEQDWSEGYTLGDERDQTIKDFKKEVSILQQLKDNKAKNVNLIHDAFDWHSQLWIVADYCTGGSVRTLMRPYEKDGRAKGLPEEYIVPIARELAVAIKSMHDLHIIHRDIKCANVYITEQGKIQLGDFGIVGVIDHDNSKRKTVIGTPHWMPREIVERLGEDTTQEGYGNEVDIWSYGCTIYEMATGSPPYSNKFPEMLPGLIESSPPQLEGAEYSTGLRDLVKFCLNPDKNARPTAADIIDHPYLKDTNRKYPTDRLVRLIEKFKIWEHGGGSRASLWMASPADPRKQSGDNNQDDDVEDELEDWNFSTSDDFDQEFTRRYSQVAPSALAQYDTPPGSWAPTLSSTQGLSIAEQIRQEHKDKSAARGAATLGRLYDLNDPSGYQLTTPVETPTSAQIPQVLSSSDLPLRSFTEAAPTRESMIVLDLDEADPGETATSTFAMHMGGFNEDTIKPAGRHHQDDDDDDGYPYGVVDDSDKRATMDWSFPGTAPPVVAKRDTMAWKFPGTNTVSAAAAPPIQQVKRGTLQWTFDSAEPAEPDDDDEPTSASHPGDFSSSIRPPFRHHPTEPAGHFATSTSFDANRDSVASMIDLDAGYADSAQHGAEIVRPSTANSIMTDSTNGDPFELDEGADQREMDVNRFSYHKQWRSEGEPELKRNSHRTMPMHERGNSLSSTESDMPQTAVESGYGGYQLPTSGMRFSALEQGLAMAAEAPIGNQWPNFSSYNGFETSPQYSSMANDAQMPRMGQFSRSREPSTAPSGPEIDFPHVAAPHPDALVEGADDLLLEAEMGRMLGDLGESLVAVGRALRQTAGIERDDDEVSSDIDSGFDSNRDVTEDEAEGLTARRQKPRRPSPHLPAPQTFQ